MTTLLGPYSLSTTNQTPFDVEWDQTQQPPIGVELQNISGLLLMVKVGGSQYWLTPWTARYFEVAQNSVKLTVEPLGDLSPTAADPLRLIATVFEVNDTPPDEMQRSLASLALVAGISGEVTLANGAVVNLANGAVVGIQGTPSVGISGTATVVQSVATSLQTASVQGIPPGTFGNGSDGNVTVIANTTLTRDMNYSALTINPSVTLFTGGYRVRCTGTITINGAIDNSAVNGVGGKTGTYPGGANGISVSSSGSAGISPTAATIEGGTGGNAVNGGTTYAGGTVVAAPSNFSGLLSGVSLSGGASGGGYSPGAGTANSGGGGGVVWIAANAIAGSGTISANGGTANGFNGFPAGAGGGGGGLIAIQTHTLSNTLTISANGGDGGNPSGGPTVTPGAAGQIMAYVA